MKIFSNSCKRYLIGKDAFKNIKLVVSRLCILYESGIVYKYTKNGLPPFRLILSANGIPSNKLVKICTTIFGTFIRK